MKKDRYHHGNLKKELIKAGLEIIAKEGENALSLRRAAMMCGVSHAAPKSHFDSKEDFLEAIEQSVTSEVIRILRKVAEKHEGKNKFIFEFGTAYIKYFVERPYNYLFIVNKKEFDIKSSKYQIKDTDFEPFQIFKENTESILEEHGEEKESIPVIILSLWAFFNGVAGLLICNGFQYDGDKLDMIGSMLKQNKWCII